MLGDRELVTRGIENFIALVNNQKQPSNDIQQAFFKNYGPEMKKLLFRANNHTLKPEVHTKVAALPLVIPNCEV